MAGKDASGQPAGWLLAAGVIPVADASGWDQEGSHEGAEKAETAGVFGRWGQQNYLLDWMWGGEREQPRLIPGWWGLGNWKDVPALS